MPDNPTPLEAALVEIFSASMESKTNPARFRAAVRRFEAAAKAEAVEPIAQALLEPTAITCDADGVVLSDRLVRAIEGIAEARRALSTEERGTG